MVTFFQFEVELRDITPRIWRRFLLRRPASLYDLHLAIQACGWTESHLWFFGHNYRTRIAIDAEAEEEDSGVPDASEIPVSRVFKKRGDRLLYVYDYGDDWHHDVTFLGRRDLDTKVNRILLAGERAFPKEDMGGVHGYQVAVAALEGRPLDVYEDDDREDLLAWLEDWKPDEVDMEAEKADFGEDMPFDGFPTMTLG